MLSSKLRLWAAHCLCALWIWRLYRLSSSPGGAETLLTPHSHPSIPFSSIPQCPVYSLQACGHATSETPETTKVLMAALVWSVTVLTIRTTRGCAGVLKWCSVLVCCFKYKIKNVQNVCFIISVVTHDILQGTYTAHEFWVLQWLRTISKQ